MRWRAMTLLLCSLLACSEAMVVMQTGNFTLEFPSLPADFGAPIPPKGLTGLLLLADPQDACTELKPPQWPEAPWVALIARSQQKDGCTFDIKVAHAEAAGAVAAVVYDDVFEPLILMAKDSRHPDPFIPSTFVTQKSGILMKRLMVEGETVVTLTPLSEALWLSMVMSAVAGFLAVNVVLGALWIIRRQRGGSAGAPGRPAPRPGMTASEIRALPIMVYEEQAPGPGGAAASGTAGMSAWGGSGGGEEANEEGQQQAPLQGGSDSGSDSGRHGGGTRHVCTICLENYIAGEKLRVLPCQHRYHVGCVDQWLSTRRPVCPVCKQGAHVPSSPPEYESEGEEAGPSGGRQQVEDLEAGHVPAQRQQRLRRRRRRHRATSFLLGRLGTGWAVLRRQLLGVPAGEGGASAARGGGGSGGGEPQEEQQQQLLAGSRTSSPIPAGTGAGGVAGVQQEQPESAATLTNFPAFFPALRRAGNGRERKWGGSTSSGGRGVHSEIVPAEGTEVEAEAEARGTTVAAVFAAAPSTELPAGRRRSQHWRTGGSGAAFTSDSVASSPCGGPHSHLVQVQPDSTEGSETESELE